MISYPRYGWCKFYAGRFQGSPSYLTDVPVDLLNGFIDWTQSNCAIVNFDEEGTDFLLVLNDSDAYIIKNADEATLYVIDKHPRDLALELLADLDGNEQEWVDNFICCDEDEKQEYFNTLIELEYDLKTALAGGK